MTDKTARERMLAGEPYRADDPELVESLRCDDLCAAYNATSRRQPGLQRELLEQLLGSVGEGVVIRPPVQFDYGVHTHIGEATFVNWGFMCLDCAEVRIGAHAQIGPGVQLCPPTHPIEPGPRRDGWEAAQPITIGDNVWLGGGVVVCPGVTIGENTVVGAGSVVVKDLPANVVAVGNPARIVRHIED